MMVFEDVYTEGDLAVLVFADPDTDEKVELKVSDPDLFKAVEVLGWEGSLAFFTKEANACQERARTGEQKIEEERRHSHVISNGQAAGDTGLN